MSWARTGAEAASPVTAAREHYDSWRIASHAGTELRALRKLLDQGHDPDEIRRRADLLSHEVIAAELAKAYPEDPVLSEESADSSERLDSRRVWIVDPLDGTREFGEPDRSDWAVHVALVVDRTPAAGAVALPVRGLTLATMPAWKLPPVRHRKPRMVVSRTRPPRMALEVAEKMGATLVEMGSAGAKAMSVLLGDSEIYLHAGGQYEWDSAAPAAVSAASGLHVSRIDGSPLMYNSESAWLPDLLICRREYAGQVLGIIAELTRGEEASGQPA